MDGYAAYWLSGGMLLVGSPVAVLMSRLAAVSSDPDEQAGIVPMPRGNTLFFEPFGTDSG